MVIVNKNYVIMQLKILLLMLVVNQLAKIV